MSVVLSLEFITTAPTLPKDSWIMLRLKWRQSYFYFLKFKKGTPDEGRVQKLLSGPDTNHQLPVGVRPSAPLAQPTQQSKPPDKHNGLHNQILI